MGREGITNERCRVRERKRGRGREREGEEKRRRDFTYSHIENGGTYTNSSLLKMK